MRQRNYHNFYTTFTKKKLSIGFEASVGFQKNSLKSDLKKTGIVYGGLLIAKYQFLKKLGVFGRVENFSDPNQILTGASLDIGKNINGSTIGIEFAPQKTVALSVEYRLLQADKTIFKQGKKMTNQRQEFNLCLDLWF